MSKPKYESHVKHRLETIRAWKRHGLTDEEICKNLGIGRESFYLYKRKHPELSEALKSGLDDSVAQVENALFRSGLGYEYEEVKIISEPTGKLDADGNPVILERTEKTTKHIPGNVTAQIFYLKNRSPKEWHDRKEYEFSGKDGKDMVIRVRHKKFEDKNSCTCRKG